MKPALLFLLLLIVFFSCKRPENPIKGQDQIHEINIGSSGGYLIDKNGNQSWQFYYFWRLNLETDSVYKKRNPFFIGLQEDLEIERGKFPLQENRILQSFINEAVRTENQTYFKKPYNPGAVCGPPLLIIEYKNGKSSKIFFFEKGNQAFSDLINLLSSPDFKRSLFPVFSPINLHEDQLINKIKNSPYFDSLQSPPSVQRTIKFTPPIEKISQ